MSAIINGDSPSVTFSDGTTQSTAFTTGSVNQAKLATGVAGTGPIYAAYASANQSVSAGTFTKVNYDTAYSFGPATNGWDATNKRFTPTVAGYYSVTGYLYNTAPSGWANQSLLMIYKNGSAHIRAQDAASANYNLSVNGLVYLNGTTDYIEIYVYSSGATTISGGSDVSWLRGCLVRSA